MMKYCRAWTDAAVGQAFGDVGGAFRRGLRFSGRSCRSVSGTALRTRGVDGSSTTVAIEGTGGSAYAGGRRRGETRKAGTTSAACGECAARGLDARFGRVDPGIGSVIDAQPGDVSRPTGCRVALCGVMPLR